MHIIIYSKHLALSAHPMTNKLFEDQILVFCCIADYYVHNMVAIPLIMHYPIITAVFAGAQA